MTSTAGTPGRNHDRTPGRTRGSRAPIRQWVSGQLKPDVRRVLDRLARTDDVRHIAVMPDVHLAREVCIGTVFATSQLIYPGAIGGDIGCGMAAVAFDAAADGFDINADGDQLRRVWRQAVPIQRHRAAAARELRESAPAADRLSASELQHAAERVGVVQLGTLGTGNHFLELQYDADDLRFWLMVHSGSRGMGQVISAFHMANAKPGSTTLRSIEADSPAGRACLNDMQWAREYAAASRRCMLLAAGHTGQSLFGWRMMVETLFDCDHNHINREEHLGDAAFVHRKGAMSAFKGAAGIVPGSMADPSYHVVGRGVEASLCSSAHGAGRVMSRSEARRRISRTDVRRQLSSVNIDHAGLSGLREEAPAAYKDIREVMRAQRKLVSVVRTLNPLLSYKGVK